jgi:hypothetical protein
MDIPQIIFEEGIEFEDEEQYNNFITFCEWYIFDDDIEVIKDLKHEDCLIYKQLCFEYIEPNFIDREMIKHSNLELND